VVRLVSNPPNPWDSAHVEWLEEPPEAQLEVHEEHAKSILAENDSPDVGFRWSLNPYRGCFHACAYCLSGDTPILMADGRQRALRDIRVGDHVYGTVVRGRYRRFTPTPVLDHWRTEKPAYRITLADGTKLIASGDHRFLSERGWKHVAGLPPGGGQRPFLTANNSLLGTGHLAPPPEHDQDYRDGYLCGMIRGDGLLRSYSYDGRRRDRDQVHQFRLALVDTEGLTRTRRFLEMMEVTTHDLVFQAATATRKEVRAIRTSVRAHVGRIRSSIEWPIQPSIGWSKGFLAGIFDAEGGYLGGILRISNCDQTIITQIGAALGRFGFDHVVETIARERPVHNVRVRGGLREHLRFFQLVDPAITRKRTFDDTAVKSDADLRVVSVEELGVVMPMFDITTGTGDFIADGVISHNCYARPSHQWLGFGAGTDFERKIVVKVNAPELLRAQFLKPSWKGELIAFSGDTDCYQPLEASYELTRRCLEVCAEFKNPVGLITKSAVIRRDVELLARLARDARIRVTLSIPFARDDTARSIEPGASSPSRRFDTLRILSDAGVPTGVAIAPIIPGLNDPDIPEILERAHAAGATSAFMIMVRLPGEVLPVFRERINQELSPERVRKIEHAIEELRGGGGRMNDSRFGARFRGQGERWRAIESLFELHRRRLGFDEERTEGMGDDAPTTFVRPTRQLGLF
jgi:DNA repair photolyase